MSSKRVRRVLVAASVSMLATAGSFAVSAPAHAAAFSMSLVGGTFTLGGQTTLGLAGTAACQDGADSEKLAPFGSPDGLIDYPADPECVNAFDNDETTPGMQSLSPVPFVGTIDGFSNFSVTSTWPAQVFTLTRSAPFAGQCDDDLLVSKVTSQFSDLAPQTGNLNAGTLDLSLRLDTTLDIECDTDMGAGTNFTPYDLDGPGGDDPWGGATPVVCSHDISTSNVSASGDTAGASTSKTQSPTVTAPMAGKELQPAQLFGDVFDAVPIAVPDGRCPFFDAFVFGTASTDNSTLQFAFIEDDYDYSDQPGIDVNVGDVTIPEGDGGRGALGCGGKDCKNKADVIVTLSSPATVDSTVTVIADNTTGGSAFGTPKGTEVLIPGPADYKETTALKPKVLKIKAGKSTAKFSISITPDQAVEGPETIFVDVISVSAGLVENDGVGMVTILDDDDATEPDIGIRIGDATVYESGVAAGCGGALKCKGTAVLPIVSSSPVGVDTAITYTVTNGVDVIGVFDAAEAVNGKTLGDDFGPVLIAKTKTLKTGKNMLGLVLTILGDNDDENGAFLAETFTVQISGAGVVDGIGTVRINNDDV